MAEQRQAPDLTDAVLREVGPRLRAARLKRDLPLEALSGATGISASTLSRLEAGKRAPNLGLLLPITRALRLSLDELLMRKAPDPACALADPALREPDRGVPVARVRADPDLQDDLRPQQ
ncbi:helix-turn-helix domain-containing protein [Streptosporangium sp. NPDC050855]|uniref:helix-turn-helix domain-containing protein n=1 Tax=Streptosporangium sp. NPDC050855 TaxID=3366194 RepID=UPI00378777CC